MRTLSGSTNTFRVSAYLSTMEVASSGKLYRKTPQLQPNCVAIERNDGGGVSSIAANEKDLILSLSNRSDSYVDRLSFRARNSSGKCFLIVREWRARHRAASDKLTGGFSLSIK